MQTSFVNSIFARDDLLCFMVAPEEF